MTAAKIDVAVAFFNGHDAGMKPVCWIVGDALNNELSATVTAAANQRRIESMKTWTKPAFQNLRYGFEINLYVKVR